MKTELTQKLNKMTKRELVYFALHYTNGGIYESFSKSKLVEVLVNRIIVNERNIKLEKLGI
jgi:hypothetical protein